MTEKEIYQLGTVLFRHLILSPLAIETLVYLPNKHRVL